MTSETAGGQQLGQFTEPLESRLLMCLDHILAALDSSDASGSIGPATSTLSQPAGPSNIPAAKTSGPKLAARKQRPADAPYAIARSITLKAGQTTSPKIAKAVAAAAPTGLPDLHSLPGAPAAIFLDFIGTDDNLADYDVDGDPSSFNATEQSQITDAWKHISSYFSEFNVDVTTTKPTVPMAWHLSSNAVSGGYSYVGVFPNSIPRSFNNSGDARTRKSGIAHELGHNFGLQHQSTFDLYGRQTAEYSNGYDATHGPIMGVDYARSIHKFFIGHPSGSPATLQDDIKVISNKLKSVTGVGDGFRADDFGGSIATAQPMTGSGGTFGGSGIIERMADTDMFSFTSSGGRVSINLTPPTPSYLAAKLEIYDGSGTLIGAKDDTDSRNGADNVLSMTANLPSAGTYYVAVASHGDYSDLGMYDLSVSGLSSLPPETVSTAVAAPAAPTLSLGTDTGLTLSWSDVSGESGFAVERSLDGATFSQIGTTGPNVTTYADTGLFGAMRYFYRVRALDSSSVKGPASAIVSRANRPNAPFSVTATSWLTNSIVLNWRDVSGDTGYRIERSSDGVNFAQIATVATNVPSYTDTGLTTNTGYTYRVSALSSDGASAATVVTGSTRLDALTGLKISAVAPSSISLQWNAVANATSYRIERATADDGTYSSVGTIAAPAVDFTDTTVSPLKEYLYHVIGVNSQTESQDTTTIAFGGTPAAVQPPAPFVSNDIGSPAGVGATGYGSGTYTLIAGGSQIGGTSDTFRFVSQPVEGTSADIQAQLTTLENTDATNGKGGVMIRETTAANSRFVFFGMSGGGTLLLSSRSTAGGSTTTTKSTTGNAAPLWLRLGRSGSTFTAYTSSDGVSWTSFASVSVSMASTANIGLALTAGITRTLNTSKFTNVTVANVAPTVATAASASPTTVTSGTTALSVLGADDHGEANLTYTWSAVGNPPGAVTFTSNGTNAAKATTATFTVNGTYTLLVTIQDSGGLSVTSSVQVAVNLPDSALQSVVIGDGTAQRSTVKKITVNFDRAVGAIDSGAFSLDRVASDATRTAMAVSAATVNNGLSIELTFAANADTVNGSLADGIYELVIHPSLIHGANGNAIGGADQTVNFHRLFGDINGDRTVGGIDYFQFAKAYGQTVPDPVLAEAFDYDGNGVVGGSDYFQFSRRYGKPVLA